MKTHYRGLAIGIPLALGVGIPFLFPSLFSSTEEQASGVDLGSMETGLTANLQPIHPKPAPRSSSAAESQGEKPVKATQPPAGLFPHYGSQEILPGLRLQDLPLADLDPKETLQAARAVQMLALQLTRETYRKYPEVRQSFVSFDEAIELSSQGFLVMKGDDPQSEGGSRFFVCPPDQQERLNELKLAGQWVYQSPRYVEATKAKVLSKASKSAGSEGLVLDVRSDGTGIDVRNAEGEPISWTRFNIPGIITGFLPPKQNP